MALSVADRLRVAVVGVLLMAACSDGQPATPRVAPSAVLSPSPSFDCSNQAEIIADPEARGPGTLNADVDGDGESDEVSLAIDEDAADLECRFFLVVETVEGAHSVTIDQEGLATELQAPSLVTAAQVDAAGGLEVVVRLLGGASTDFSGVFTYTGDELRRVSVEGGPSGDLFPSGGTVAHVEGSDCADGGLVVISEALANGPPGSYEVTRRFFEPADDELQIRRDLTEKLSLEEAELSQLPEFRSPPFGSCPAG
jgi:hypothetical protein